MGEVTADNTVTADYLEHEVFRVLGRLKCVPILERSFRLQRAFLNYGYIMQ